VYKNDEETWDFTQDKNECAPGMVRSMKDFVFNYDVLVVKLSLSLYIEHFIFVRIPGDCGPNNVLNGALIDNLKLINN
jgi:hypothetical protein